jgi:nicotinate-nucleotide adenylyltransferase
MCARLAMPLNIAIFGGAFNPPHQGHLLVARNALRVASLDRVLFVPSAVPPHKDDGSLVPGPDRLEMVRLAIDGDPRMEALPIEIERGGISLLRGHGAPGAAGAPRRPPLLYHGIG